jgi:hypothetical protein
MANAELEWIGGLFFYPTITTYLPHNSNLKANVFMGERENIF